MAKGDRSERVRRRAMAHWSIADAVVIKDEDLFMITLPSGDAPFGREEGLGIYHHDCRYLGGYQLALEGSPLAALGVDAGRGFAASFVLTNPLALGEKGPAAHEIGVTRERVLEANELSVHEIVTVESFAAAPAKIRVSLSFHAGFEDVFVVRGVRGPTTAERRLVSGGGRLSFSYEGRDHLVRAVDVRVSPEPSISHGATFTWDLQLDPRQKLEILVSIRLSEVAASKTQGPGESPGKHGAPPPFGPPDHAAITDRLHRSVDAWMGERTRIRSDSPLLDATIHRSLLDLRVLHDVREGHGFFSGGVPWYVTLFGRDSLTAALSTLAFEPGVAAETLRLLARHQGKKEDPKRDEEPGKIPHEYRVGELANAGDIPFGPYYGTIDATALFLILLARHAEWTGRLDLFHELEDNVARALAWLLGNMERSPGGWVSYESRSSGGLDNQGWKDSEDAIVNADGGLADPPIALAEVQGYAYLALTDAARLHERAGDAEAARRLRERASALRARFNERFWLEDEGVFALALQAGDRPAAVVSSNAGQALWSGIADPDRARRTAARLMERDMWSGWGVRTLSERARRYNPAGYHLGTVWPHDNALIAAGLRRYRQDDAAIRICTGIFELAGSFPYNRLPELITGFARDRLARPALYPIACHPQAWAAGAAPYLLQTVLGLCPDAFAGRLRVVRPCLPPFVSRVDVEGLRVGEATVDLHFERRPDGAIEAEARRAPDGLSVEVEREGDF